MEVRKTPKSYAATTERILNVNTKEFCSGILLGRNYKMPLSISLALLLNPTE
jgi:hypothetical protein